VLGWTATDRGQMDDVVTNVNEGWNNEGSMLSMQHVFIFPPWSLGVCDLIGDCELSHLSPTMTPHYNSLFK
jgi:hypothetical protein